VPGSQSRSELTRVRLIETAEELFAERGLEGVSLRDVCAAAGQRNHSAAQYHFGSRAALILAVFEHRMPVVNARRHALLDLADDDAEAIVDALVRPLTSVVAESNAWYGRFLERIRWDPLAGETLDQLPTWTSYARALKLLDAQLPDLPNEVRANRLDQVGTLLIGTVAAWEWRRQRGLRALTLDALDRDLISTLVAVVHAPAATDRALHPTPWETT
jgi:AcrR family transcriptional regulator